MSSELVFKVFILDQGETVFQGWSHVHSTTVFSTYLDACNDFVSVFGLPEGV